MLPFVKSYCKSIENTYRFLSKLQRVKEVLENLEPTNDKHKEKTQRLMEKIQEKYAAYIKRMQTWGEELSKLNLFICSLASGCIDIPILDKELQEVIMLCIHAKTKPNKIVYHLANENYINAKPYNWTVAKNKKKKS